MKKMILAGVMVLLVGLPIMAKQNKPVVKLDTNKGVIIIELNGDKAPETVKNFLAYAKQGFYNGTIFHRVIPDFMIQGGGFLPGLEQKKTMPPITNEANNGLKNLRGTIAMARTYVISSATSQFFINTKDNGFLDYRGPSNHEYGYAVFGKVIEGMDVVDAISASPTHTVDRYENVPEEDIVINSVELISSANVK